MKEFVPLFAKRQRFVFVSVCFFSSAARQLAYLTPYEHGAEHDLQAIEEVVADEDDRGSASGPAFTGANGLYARGSCL